MIPLDLAPQPEPITRPLALNRGRIRQLWHRSTLAWDHVLEDIAAMGVIDFDDALDDDLVDVQVP